MSIKFISMNGVGKKSAFWRGTSYFLEQLSPGSGGLTYVIFLSIDQLSFSRNGTINGSYITVEKEWMWGNGMNAPRSPP